MANDSSSLLNELRDLLSSAAMYNDKGYIWMGHSPAKRSEMEAEFREKMLTLLEKIGPGILEPELEKAIVSGAAARDEFGYFSGLAQPKEPNV